LLWISQSKDSGEESKYPFSEILLDLLTSWHHHIKKNTVNNIFPSLLENPKDFTGAPRLFLATLSSLSFSINKSLDQTPISIFPEKLKQLSELQNTLPQEIVRENVEFVHWEYLILFHSWFFAAQKDHFNGETYDFLMNQFGELAYQFHQLRQNSTERTQLQTAITSFIKKIKEKIVLSTSNYILGIYHEILTPFFNLIIERVSQQFTLNFSHLAQCWILTGQLMLSSFMLLSPIDPSSKEKFRLDMLLQEKFDLETEIKARQDVELVLSGKVINEKIKIKQDRLLKVLSKIEEASKKVTIRPQPSQIQELFNEFQQANKTLLNKTNIMDLSQALLKFSNSSLISREKLFQVKKNYLFYFYF